jgi:LEA14-like dessication related protein
MSRFSELQNLTDNPSPFSPGKVGIRVVLTFLMVFVGGNVVGQNPPSYSWEKAINLGTADISKVNNIIIAVDTDSNGFVYTLTFGGILKKYDSDGNSLGNITLNADIEGPVDMAINSYDEVFVADHEGRMVFAFDLNGNNLVSKNKSSSYFKPLGIAFDKNDDLYVVDYNDGTGAENTPGSRLKIHYYNGGQSSDLLKNVLIQPYRIDVDSNGNIFISHSGSSGNGEVRIFNNNFQDLGILQDIGSPGSIEIDKFDFIHVIDYANKLNLRRILERDYAYLFGSINSIRQGINNEEFTIQIYDSSRNNIQTVVSQLDLPIDLAFGICASKMYVNDATISSGFLPSIQFNLEFFRRSTSFDIERPVASCIAAGKEFILANGYVTITTADIDAGSSDNCSLTLSLSQTTFTTPGIKDITLTATDNAGNTSSCITTIEIKNPLTPPINCKPTTIFLGTNGIAILNPADIFDGNSNASDIDYLEVDKKDFTCLDLGSQSVQLIVFYNNGTTAVCNSQVTIADNINPVAQCIAPGKEFILVNGSVTITTADIDAGSSDNCSLTLSLSQTTFTAPGIKNITLTATDNAGNTSSCPTTIEIKNPSAPPINCKPTTIFLGTNGIAILNPADVFDGNSNASDIDYLEVDKKDFTCTDLGSQSVQLTVFYNNGTTAVCNTQVTIADNINPVTQCIAPGKEFILVNGSVTITTADIDAGSSDNCSLTLSLSQTTFTAPGVKDITLTATDIAGNTSSCPTTIEIKNPSPPPINCKPTTIFLGTNGIAILDPADVFGGNSNASDIDYLEVDKKDFTCPDLGSQSVQLTVFYNNGTTAVCNTQVTITDTIAPVANCATGYDIWLNANGTASLNATEINKQSSDNCGVVSMEIDKTTFTSADIGLIMVTLTVIDIAGNSDSCETSVTVHPYEQEEPSEETFEYIFIYPNPTPGPFTFDMPTGWSLEKVEVYDARGRYVLTETYSENQFEYSMDLSSLQQSVYILKLYTSQGIRIIRVIIY